jgi:ribonuclease HII
MLLVRHTKDDKIEAGLDEAGRGSFWGPIMAGAVVWPIESEWTDAHRSISSQIRDSKKISPKKREKICDEIKRLATSWGVGSVTANEIDEKGIQWANQEAFRRALSVLVSTDSSGNTIPYTKVPQRLIIDGVIGMEDPVEDREQYNIIEGDALYMPIAAASILAKVEHDRWVCDYCEKNPEYAERYSLLTCKGYGTAKHRNGLSIYGAHELHRRTFVRKYVGDSSTSNGGAGVPTIIKSVCKIKL